MIRLLIVSCLALVLAACSDETKPYLSFGGGGFVYNYRIGEMYYGFVAQVHRKLPDGAVLVARFEDPAGGAEIIDRQPVVPGRAQYMFRTPPVKGVVKDKPYTATLTLENPGGEGEIERISRTFASTADPSLFPSGPLVVGPGYTPNPDLTGPYAPAKP